MEDNILKTIKSQIPIDENDDSFDTELITHINSVFMILNQLGVGTTKTFRLNDGTETWSDFLNGSEDVEGVKTYVYMKVKLIFDPPLSSAVMETMKQMISEFEWRLRDSGEEENDE